MIKAEKPDPVASIRHITGSLRRGLTEQVALVKAKRPWQGGDGFLWGMFGAVTSAQVLVFQEYHQAIPTWVPVGWLAVSYGIFRGIRWARWALLPMWLIVFLASADELIQFWIIQTLLLFALIRIKTSNEPGERLIWIVLASGVAAQVGLLAYTITSFLAGWLILSYFILRRHQWARWAAVTILGFFGLLCTGYVLPQLLFTGFVVLRALSLQHPLATLVGTVVAGVVVFADVAIFAFSEPVRGFVAGRKGALTGRRRRIVAGYSLAQVLAAALFVYWSPIGLGGTLAAGVVFFVDAAILAFSESVGDFFGGRRGAIAVTEWASAAQGLSVRQRGEHVPREGLVETSDRRREVGQAARFITLLALVLSWVIFLAATSFAMHFAFGVYQFLISKTEAGPFLLLDYIWEGLALLLSLALILAAGYFLLFVMPTIFALPFVFPFAWSWHAPSKFLVLRPFNKSHITAELTRFLRDKLAPFGHCYTLSDQEVRVPLHIRIPLLLGQLSFLHFRLHKIRRPRHLERLVAAMRKTVRRNLNWCFSRTKIFPVTCCDSGWQACVRRLVEEVDAVVVDLSALTGNIVWELELLRDTGSLSRTVFVVQEFQMTRAQKEISQILGIEQPPILLPYGRTVASGQSDARTYIADALC